MPILMPFNPRSIWVGSAAPVKIEEGEKVFDRLLISETEWLGVKIPGRAVSWAEHAAKSAGQGRRIEKAALQGYVNAKLYI